MDADGKALDKKGNKVALDKATYRIDIYNVDESGLGTNKAWGLPKGAKLTVAPENNVDMALLKQLKPHAGVATVVDTLPNYPESVDTPEGGEGEGTEGGENATPTPTPEVKVPTGFKVTYNEDTTGDHYINSKTGVFTADDVKNGEITKVFKVKNNNDETICARVEFQVAHTKADGGKTWKGPVVGEVITIEPGETEELSYTAEVENGKVTVEDTEYDISELFVRFDFYSENNGKTVPEGTTATVYCEQKIAEQFAAGGARAFGEKLTFELVYDKVSNSVGSGDVLPVAFIALVTVATVALVVVSKKKREEI